MAFAKSIQYCSVSPRGLDCAIVAWLIDGYANICYDLVLVATNPNDAVCAIYCHRERTLPRFKGSKLNAAVTKS